MDRKQFLKSCVVLSIFPVSCSMFARKSNTPFHRVRPGDIDWPSKKSWDMLNQQVEGRLRKIESPLESCNLSTKSCSEVFQKMKNPFFISEQPSLTQTLGWADAWTSSNSVYAIEAEKTADIVAGINFAREKNLRLVVKGGAHSYQGRSNARDSLLIWTRPMNGVTLHESFIPKGCNGTIDPQPAVSIEAGAIWIDAYDAVTTKGGRYVQGGGCTTVGVAGLIQSGGFGSFSKNYGLAAGGLLEAEVVTADGEVRIANACINQDLFWALKGGGGGSFGVVTRLTLRTRELPEFFGGVFGSIKAVSDEAFRSLTENLLQFYRDHLFNPHWGEQIHFRTNRSVDIQMVIQGLTKQEAINIWQPFVEWIIDEPGLIWHQPLQVMVLPARHLWDADYLRKNFPDLIIDDDRPNSKPSNFIWAGDQSQAGQYIHGFRSLWLSESLLEGSRLSTLADKLIACIKYWDISLQFNKGLAGAPEDELAAAKDTAMNPVVLDAFALVIVAGEEPLAIPGVSGHEPEMINARQRADSINKAMEELLKIVPHPGSYLSESNYFEVDWKQSFWGSNYPRLAAVKKKFDPKGLFYIHHGVGSDQWSDNGFTMV
jgi:FAD/FMN-containing dehydrogenase